MILPREQAIIGPSLWPHESAGKSHKCLLLKIPWCIWQGHSCLFCWPCFPSSFLNPPGIGEVRLLLCLRLHQQTGLWGKGVEHRKKKYDCHQPRLFWEPVGPQVPYKSNIRFLVGFAPGMQPLVGPVPSHGVFCTFIFLKVQFSSWKVWGEEKSSMIPFAPKLFLLKKVINSNSYAHTWSICKY